MGGVVASHKVPALDSLLGTSLSAHDTYIRCIRPPTGLIVRCPVELRPVWGGGHLADLEDLWEEW